MCGEHRYEPSFFCHTTGSSPRVRGTLDLHDCHGAVQGIIPACAGNTVPGPRLPWFRRDHPRVCGEHLDDPQETTLAEGSSPRVRGTPHHRQLHADDAGIIPACAGNTYTIVRAYCDPGDHPRVCGEHLSYVALVLHVLGSSPRVRGTPSRIFDFLWTAGIIPACAGNTPCGRTRRRAVRDHPRVCGEHDLAYSRAVYGQGSSPRVRGTLTQVKLCKQKTGIIPACAGNT